MNSRCVQSVCVHYSYKSMQSLIAHIISQSSLIAVRFSQALLCTQHLWNNTISMYSITSLLKPIIRGFFLLIPVNYYGISALTDRSSFWLTFCIWRTLIELNAIVRKKGNNNSKHVFFILLHLRNDVETFLRLHVLREEIGLKFENEKTEIIFCPICFLIECNRHYSGDSDVLNIYIITKLKWLRETRRWTMIYGLIMI